MVTKMAVFSSPRPVGNDGLGNDTSNCQIKDLVNELVDKRMKEAEDKMQQQFDCINGDIAGLKSVVGELNIKIDYVEWSTDKFLAGGVQAIALDTAAALQSAVAHLEQRIEAGEAKTEQKLAKHLADLFQEKEAVKQDGKAVMEVREDAGLKLADATTKLAELKVKLAQPDIHSPEEMEYFQREISNTNNDMAQLIASLVKTGKSTKEPQHTTDKDFKQIINNLKSIEFTLAHTSKRVHSLEEKSERLRDNDPHVQDLNTKFELLKTRVDEGEAAIELKFAKATADTVALKQVIESTASEAVEASERTAKDKTLADEKVVDLAKAMQGEVDKMNERIDDINAKTANPSSDHRHGYGACPVPAYPAMYQ